VISLSIFISYLLGSIIGSLVIGRFRGIDIRQFGSGNPGAANALRTRGKGFALGVLLIDTAKGWLATGSLAELPRLATADFSGRAWVSVLCGLAALLGHIYPVWFGFRGGKGVATLIGVVLGLAPSLLLPMLLAWLVAVAVTGFVGLASMAAALSLAVILLGSAIEPRAPLETFGVLAALLILFTHRFNIARMLAGTEPRARRLWLLRSS
jgi:glycerol-3-phosphate acyltransferase PlsY